MTESIPPWHFDPTDPEEDDDFADEFKLLEFDFFNDEEDLETDDDY